jgi:arabinose-5-phosphate isomerase
MNDIQSAKRTIQKEIDAIRVMEKNLDESLTKALDLIQNAKGRLIVTGMGKAGHIGSKIAASMASTGTPAFFVHPGEASHGDLGMITEKDVVLAISNSGESKELSDLVLFCKRYGIPLIALTKKADSALGKAGDILLKLPDAEEACPLGLAPTSSTTSMLVMGDILAIALLERRGFTKTDYNARHPGGKLGAILMKVSDLMHKGDEVPLVPEGTSMQTALVTMTAKMLGCVGIINPKGDLEGMITDGDLRRYMTDNMFSRKVEDIMTRNPKTTTADILAVEALKIMNDKKVTQLFVLEGAKPVGVIHLHDCLRAGVA